LPLGKLGWIDDVVFSKFHVVKGERGKLAAPTVDERSGSVVHELEFISDGVKRDGKYHRAILYPLPNACE